MDPESPKSGTQDNKKKNEIQGTYREYGPYLTLGFQLAAAVVVFFFLGDWIDKRYGITPIGKLVGTSIGMVGGFVKFFKSVGSMIADEEKNRTSDSMKIDWSFLRLVFFCFICTGALAYYPISEFATREVMNSIIAGSIMSLANLLLGYVAIEVSFERSHTIFLKYVLGGMVGRLMLMWGTFLLLIRVFGFHPASLMLSLLFFYVMNLGLEIYYLQKRVTAKNKLSKY